MALPKNKYVRYDIPMSEDSSKIKDGWTAEQCIEELRRIASEHYDQVITRNYFRVHSKIAESVWQKFFGTFEEFKRQAGVKLSRQAHAMERKVALHASREHYRALGLERLGYSDKYARPSQKRYKTVLVASDLHDIEVDRFLLRVLIDTAKRVKPDAICLNGDIFDLPEFGRYNVDPRDWNVVDRIKFVHEYIFSPLREASPGSQIDLIEGNHENRLLRHLADATPAMKVLLSDLHGWSVAKLLGLDRYEINYIAKADLAAINKKEIAKELGKNYKVYWDVFLAHHFPEGKRLAMPGWNGHHHSHYVWQFFNPSYGAYEWHQLGAGHRRDAEYCAGEKWGNGFLIANCNVDTKSTVMDYCQVTDFAVVGGKFYTRTKEEGAGLVSVWPGK